MDRPLSSLPISWASRGEGLKGIFIGHTVVSHLGSHGVPMIDLFEYLNFTLYLYY